MPITILSWVFIVVGVLGFSAGMWSLINDPASAKFSEVGYASILRLVAIVAGVFMLRGKNWARWLCVLWLVIHVAIRLVHSAPFELIVHVLLLVAVLYLVTRPRAAAYFGNS